MNRSLTALRALGVVAGLLLAREAHAQGGWPVGAGATPPTQRDRVVDPAVRNSHRTGADAVDVVMLLLAKRDSIGLTAAQTMRVARIRAQRDSVVRPLWAAVDSLAVTGDAATWAKLTEEQRVVLRGQMQLRSRTLMAVREAEQAAVVAAYAELTGTQQVDVDRRVAAARTAANDSLRVRRAGGFAGFGGMRP